MKKILLLLCILVNLSFAQFGASLGFGPCHGMISVDYTMLSNHLTTNFHLISYDSDYDFMGGIGITYHFKDATGPYVFHSSEWITGEKNSFEIKYRNGEAAELIENKENINYWRLVFGVGYQHMFVKHFGAYFELGFQFFAGNGGYYTNFDIDVGSLDNDKIIFPGGLGIVVKI